MIYFETYRNNIKKLDVDENFFIKNSKIEKIFENADLFFFSRFTAVSSALELPRFKYV